jgi:hypothetical protein
MVNEAFPAAVVSSPAAGKERCSSANPSTDR